MGLHLQIIIALIYIIITQMMLNYYLINKYGKILSYDMGPKIGEIFLVDKFGMSELLNSSDTSQFKNAKALLCFISLK